MSIVNADRLSTLLNRAQLALDNSLLQHFKHDHDCDVILDEHNLQLVRSAEASYVASLAVLSEGLKDLEAASDTLLHLQDQIQSSLTQARALVAPVRRLPVELLQMMFHFVHQAQRPLYDVYFSPPVVAQVCHSWRQIAFRTPCFRMAMKIDLDPAMLSHQLERLPLWVEHFAKRPFALMIQDTERFDSDAESDLDAPIDSDLHTDKKEAGTALAKALEPHGRNISALYFKADPQPTAMLALLRTWQKSRAFSMPSLRVLDFRGAYEPHHDDWLSLRNFFRKRAVGLESLVVENESCIHFAVPPPTLKVFRGSVWPEAFQNIAACENLEILEIRYMEGWHDIQLPAITGVSPFNHLTSLHLVEYEFAGAAEYLPPLPALRHLILSHGNRHGPPADLPFVLRTWGGKLKYLSLFINIACTSLQDLQACLTLAPNLEALRLGIDECYGSQVEIVKTAKLPQLTHCEFHFIWVPPKLLRSLEDFGLRAKSDYFPLLTTLGITSDADSICTLDEEEKLVRELSKAGVMLSSEQRSTLELEAFQFEGPYFEEIGGIFTSPLYSIRNHRGIPGM